MAVPTYYEPGTVQNVLPRASHHPFDPMNGIHALVRKEKERVSLSFYVYMDTQEDGYRQTRE